MSSTIRPRRIAAGAALAVIAHLAVVAPPSASAYYDGYCKDDTGVTVVVDYQGLGGGRVIRCADNFPAGGTGYDALHRAGFTTQGTAHDGDGFICRIGGRPSASETIPVKKYPNYKERCIDTPPAAAYWSYWHAPNGGSWTYSNYGAKNRAAIIGGFEGWSFSLNATASTNPRPGVAPKRPAAPPPPPATTTPPAPSTPKPASPGAPKPVNPGTAPGSSTGTRRPTPSSSGPAGAPTSAGPSATTSESTPPSADPSASTSPSPTGDATSGQGTPPGEPAVATTQTGPPVGTLLGIGAAAVLGGAAIGVVAWRRRRH